MKNRIGYGCIQSKTDDAVCRNRGNGSSIPNGSHHLAAGTVLNGRYLIVRSIGQGGFGITYEGMDMRNSDRIALKEFFPSGIAIREPDAEVRLLRTEDSRWFEKYRKRFLHEYQILAELSSIQNIVKVSDFFFEHSTAYIIMEYIEGLTLKQYVECHGGRLSGKETFQILKPVMQSLAKIHEAGLIHRDVSPDNLMILSDGSAKLLDFGAVLDIGVTAKADLPLSKSVTAVIKNGYAPLEQYQSHGCLGPWTDVYALCATICYCLTGEAPPEALERLLQDTPVRIRKNGADISTYVEDVIKKGMELRTCDRIADMNQLLESLSGDEDLSEHTEADIRKLSVNTKASARRIKAEQKGQMVLFAVVLAVFFIASKFFHQSEDSIGKTAVNKAIAAPVHFRNYTEDMDNWYETGTAILLGCGDVAAFSKDYTFSCSLYLPKAACAADGEKMIVHWWLDMDDEKNDCHIGTTDSLYVFSLLQVQDEVFPVVTAEHRTGDVLLEKSDYTRFFHIQEAGDFYRLDVTELPYHKLLHNEDGTDRTIAIDTSRSGQIGIGLMVTGLNQSFSSYIYLDDIVIRDKGTVIKSFDCSAESLYGHFYAYEYDDDNGLRIQVDAPQLSAIPVGQADGMWWNRERKNIK